MYFTWDAENRLTRAEPVVISAEGARMEAVAHTHCLRAIRTTLTSQSVRTYAGYVIRILAEEKRRAPST